MSSEERDQLQVGILTICDPRGNWRYGWELICRVAGMDAGKHPAPFRIRTEEALQELGNAPLGPPMSRVRPPKDEEGTEKSGEGRAERVREG